MTFLQDISPLVQGPYLRALAFWIELVTFSLTLQSGTFYLAIPTFSILGILWIFDLTLAIVRWKRTKTARKLGHARNFVPSKWTIIVDFIFGFGFLALFALYVVADARIIYSIWTYLNVFSAFTLVGCLSVAHLHIFLGAVETHLLRQIEDGQEVIGQPRLKMSDARVIELTTPTRRAREDVEIGRGSVELAGSPQGELFGSPVSELPQYEKL